MTALPAAFPNVAALAHELHDTLRQLDPARWRAEQAEKLRGRLASLRQRFAPLAGETGNAQEIQNGIQAITDRLSGPIPQTTELEQWVEFRAQVSPAYEELVTALKEHNVRLPSLRPTNYTRSFLHALNGVGIIAIIELVPKHLLIYPAAAAFALVWFLEGTRRISPAWNDRIMRLFGPVAHPYENHGINSGTWYVTALMGLALFQAPMFSAVAVAVLAFADPAAALVGRRFGRTKLVNGRSLEGTAAFVLVGALVAFALMALLHPAVATGQALLIAAAAATAGGLAELFSRRIDDNLSIPWVAAAAAFLVTLI